MPFLLLNCVPLLTFLCILSLFPPHSWSLPTVKVSKMMRTLTQDTQWQAGLEQKETKQKEAVVQNSNPNYKQQNSQ